jgi:hypothetical protein
MNIERDIELCSTQIMEHLWKLFTYSRNIEANSHLEMVWKNLAENLYMMPDDNQVIQFKDIENVVKKNIDNSISDLTTLFSKEQDWSMSSIYYGSTLFLHSFRRKLFDFDLCDDNYNGCSEIISSLLSFYLGKKASVDNEQESDVLFQIFIDSSNYDFLYGCKIDDKKLEEITKEPLNFEKMILGKDRWSSAEAFMSELDEKNESEILQNYERYSPQNNFFPVVYKWHFLVSPILERKRYDLILSLLIQLKYPIFQNEILIYLLREDCVALCNEIINKNIGNTKFLAAQLLEQWFEALVKFGELLDDYENKKHLDSEFKKFIGLCKTRRENYLQNISTDLSPFIKKLGLSFVVRYFFQKKIDASLRETIHKKNYDETLVLLQETLLSQKNFNQISYSELDLSCLLSFVRQQSEANNTKKVKEVMKVIDEKILVSNSFTSITLSENNLTLMRLYSLGLSKLSQKEIIQHIGKFRVSFEGFNSSLEKKYEHVSNEVYVLCSIALLFENKDVLNDLNFKQTLFRKLTEFILNQIYRCTNENLIEQYYLMPLQLLKVIVDQIYIEEKNWFDNQIVNLDNIKHSLLIFQYNTKDLCASAKQTLKERINVEWKHEKKMSFRKRETLIESLDKIAHRLTN